MEELESELKNLMRLFLNSIRDYEQECGEAICKDERESIEFVEIFIDSEDGFNYKNIIEKFINKPIN